MEFRVGTTERFFKYVDKTEDCWIWVGSRQKSPKLRVHYGTFSYICKQYKAHRFSWMLYTGTEITEGLQVLHSCDNGFCVRPDHLFLGTNQDSIDDKVAKGRASGSIKLNKVPVSQKLPKRTKYWATLADGEQVKELEILQAKTRVESGTRRARLKSTNSYRGPN